MSDWDIVAVYMAKGLLVCALALGVLGFVQDFVL